MRIRSLLLAAALSVPIASVSRAQAPQQLVPAGIAPNIVNLSSQQPSGQIAIPLDKSQLVHVDQTFGEISVGNKEIADAVPLTKNLIYVLGKKRGVTNLTISDERGNLIGVMDVLVSYDVDSLRQGLSILVPGEKVSIRPSADALVLTGQVSSPDRLRQILSVAERYAPGGVTNLMTLSAAQQVLLEVRFAEVQRSALKDLGSRFAVNYLNNHDAFALTTGQVITPQAFLNQVIPQNQFGAIGALLSDDHYQLATQLDALEKHGLLRTLAEPNLVALSGDTASFLAGGQIPIPVAQTLAATSATPQPFVTIQYKDFGVSLSFTPTVVAREQINLELKSEVSSLDPTVSVDANGINVPGLKVRRTGTTIELKDGESFAIAGLLQDDYQDGTDGFPFLQNLPILGALFRSTNFQHQQTELAIIITAHLVDPGIARSLASPTDSVVLPTPLSLFGNGTLEGGPAPNGAPANPRNGYVLP